MKKLLLLLIIPILANAAKITDDTLIIGNPNSSGDIIIQDRSGTNIIKADTTGNAWQFSNDSGANFLDFGSGSGGGSGGLNVLLNPNAEQGLTKISNTGGTLTEVTTPLADILEGSKSFKFDPAAQNDVVKFDAVTISKGLQGRACEARVHYIGADENSVIEVVDANAKVLGSFQMTAHSIYSAESVFFLCPNNAEITGDANKGILTLQIRQSEVADGAEFTFDENYLGNLIGLVETTLPDILSVRTSVGASPVITSQSPTWVNSITRTAVGVIRYFYQPGTFTEEPICWEGSLTSGTAADVGCHVSEINLVSEYIEVSCVQGGVGQTDIDRTLSCRKVGADAKQSVQVYKSIPKVSENINEFSAKVDATGVVTNENTNWLDGDCNNPSAGRYECDYVSGLTSEPMNCSVTSTRANVSIQNDTTLWVPTTSTGFTAQNIQRGTGSIVAANGEFEVVCTKSGDDFKLPTVQPIIVGQVRNSAAEANSKNTFMESCSLNFNGASAPTVDTNCEMFQTLERYSTGAYRATFTSDFNFDVHPECTVVLEVNVNGGTGNVAIYMGNWYADNTKYEFFQTQGTTATDVQAGRKGSIICIFNQ